MVSLSVILLLPLETTVLVADACLIGLQVNENVT